MNGRALLTAVGLIWNERDERTNARSDEEIMKKIDEPRKDPKKWGDYLSSRLDRAVKNRRKR